MIQLELSLLTRVWVVFAILFLCISFEGFPWQSLLITENLLTLHLDHQLMNCSLSCIVHILGKMYELDGIIFRSFQV